MLRRVASQMRNVLGKRFIGEASHRNNRENVTENGKILCEFKNFIVLLEKKLSGFYKLQYCKNISENLY